MAIISFIIVYILIRLSSRYNRNKTYNTVLINNTKTYHSNEKQKISEAVEIKNMILLAASDSVKFDSPKCRVVANLLNSLKVYEDPDEFLDSNPHILNIIFGG